MSHVRGDIRLVIRIATIIEIFGHVLGIFWAYLGHTLGIRNGQTGLVLVLVMVWSVTEFVFFTRLDFLGLFGHPRGSLSKENMFTDVSRYWGTCLLLTWTLQEGQNCSKSPPASKNHRMSVRS